MGDKQLRKRIMGLYFDDPSIKGGNLGSWTYLIAGVNSGREVEVDVEVEI